MGNRSRDSRTATGNIATAVEGVVCDVCDCEAEVATFTGSTATGPRYSDGMLVSVNLCTYCAARLIETVTRFRMTRVLDQMYTARDTARNIRLIEP